MSATEGKSSNLMNQASRKITYSAEFLQATFRLIDSLDPAFHKPESMLQSSSERLKPRIELDNSC